MTVAYTFDVSNLLLWLVSSLCQLFVDLEHRQVLQVMWDSVSPRTQLEPT